MPQCSCSQCLFQLALALPHKRLLFGAVLDRAFEICLDAIVSTTNPTLDQGYDIYYERPCVQHRLAHFLMQHHCPAGRGFCVYAILYNKPHIMRDPVCNTIVRLVEAFGPPFFAFYRHRNTRRGVAATASADLEPSKGLGVGLGSDWVWADGKHRNTEMYQKRCCTSLGGVVQ